MKIITLAAQKGGYGKSSLAISCAVLAAHNSKRVLILDADRQETALQWQPGRDGAAPEVRQIRSPASELETALKALRQDHFDFVFVDTAGRDDAGVAAAIRAASLTLIPCRPTMADIPAMPTRAAVAGNGEPLCVLY